MTDCLNLADPLVRAFARAAADGLSALPADVHRGRLNGVTGHIGESVTEVLLAELGYAPLWHFSGPLSGGHGVDLLMLSPAETVAAVEVKATLVPGRWPRPTRRELVQLSPAWLGGPDNPGMENLQLTGGDVHGLLVVVNFAGPTWKCVGTWDFASVRPAFRPDDLASWRWISGGR